MPLKKSELYASLWKSCDELRGGMDASQYKDYVLVLLFVKYVSDKAERNPDTLIEVPYGGAFRDMVLAKGDKEIGDKLNKIINRLAEANDLTGVIDVADFNDADKLGRSQAMVDRLTKLIGIFEGLDFTSNRADGDDLLGDAYEYLMRHFATESGKSKGQFYTPAEVSQVIAKVIGIARAKNASQTIYDPTCGSGSLLLKAASEARTGVTIYGQEMDNATAALAEMNMILHNNETAEIWQDNTLSSPHWTNTDGNLKTFDYVVANPPFSTKAWSNGFDPVHDLFGRFADGIPPAKNGDYAFLLHILRSLKSTGKGAVILPHGVLFRGGAEGTIRKNLIRRGVIQGIIGLPANLFYGTGIPACIIVLDKEYATGRKGIFLMDASKGFQKDGNKNRLRQRDIHQIVDIFTKQTDISHYARMVSHAEIEANDFNLNIPRYIDTSEVEDLQDIEAHLQGGIPDRDADSFSAYWTVLPGLKDTLFAPLREGYSQVRVEAGQVRSTIIEHPEFEAFSRTIHTLFEGWREKVMPKLKSISSEIHPKELIEDLGESLLDTFKPSALVDPYAIYQHLMSYWVETMQDDVYLLIDDGWKASPELIPEDLIIHRYFPQDQEAIDALEAERDTFSRELEELEEEHGGEDGLLTEAKTDKGKFSKVSLTARLNDIRRDKEAAEEKKVLEQYLSTLEKESASNKKVKEAQKALSAKVSAQYGQLGTQAVKDIVVEDKWLTRLGEDVQAELDRVSQALTGRVKELAERYDKPLPELEAEVETLAAQVEGHLEKMGFVWK
ncbi:type I restriction-modification system subunit M [Acidithiobacillus thiooxidans]|uniref:type I restriction-modification system subunit M n=1 Tax=Acidithiobacillus thiooxidans TaxID=930 RepID=UPI001C074118|nr:type I restriction-modification system subunit M [Acidithiobacillus thiooxidans]MBU2835424.1 type I restriction-modification system subunit M [Acidithiobacillus thiooxidans]